jgi:hypothetical protein
MALSFEVGHQNDLRLSRPLAIPTESLGEIVGSAISGCGGVADGPSPETVTLRKGALVAASAGGAIWASVAEEISVEAIRRDRAHDDWIPVSIPKKAVRRVGQVARHLLHPVPVVG